MRRFLFFIPLLALVLTFRPLPTHAAEFRADSNQVTINQAVTRDTFAVSNTVSITAPITGELFLAGNTVTVNQPISRSAYVAASTITISKGAGYNLFAVGENITIDGSYGNDVYLAGTTVTVNKGTVINGDLWIEGGTVDLKGIVKGSIHLDVDTLTSSAAIGGSVSGNIGTGTFTGGSIGGNLHYTSNTDVTGLSSAKISGTVSRTAPETTGQTIWDIVKGLLTAVVAMLLLGSLLALRFPNTIASLIEDVRASYFKLLFYGLGWLILVPIACFALAVTLIGWKIALFIFLVYALFLLVAGALSMFVVGSWVYKRFVKHHRDNIWDYLITGILIVYILGAIPYVSYFTGLLFGIFAFLPSLGALGARVFERE